MTRSHDVLEVGRKSDLPITSRARLRGAWVLVWVLPALAALALATLWLVTPSAPEIDTPAVEVRQPAVPKIDAPKKPPQLAPEVPAAPVAKTPGNRDVLPKSPANDGATPPSASPQPKSLAETQQAVTGEWTGYYQGQRRLTVREGGKATMVVEPEGLAAYLLAPKVTFEILWKVNQGQLEFEIIGGEPLDKVNVVTKMYGKLRSHKILELKPEQIVLLDEDGVTEYVWNRVLDDCR